MRCPACGGELKEIQTGDIHVDVCDGGCGGSWFDWKEIKKVDEPHEIDGEALLKIAGDPARAQAISGPRSCPKCGEEELLCRRYYDAKREVEIEQCLRCSGIWLDAGELAKVRSQYSTIEDRQAAEDWILNSQLEDHQDVLERERTMLQDEIKRNRNSVSSFYKLIRSLV